ncbi:hypothetical protein PR048_030142 [Dryococelus australis]|uniref:Uncharacterized protein n=1 Tax=Dryococelus australis TaxID=614101 RepID=A0ABQ9GBZ8_9NEOP|nr:hypothetical protein PR048_030142 [Dryococelus australis]
MQQLSADIAERCMQRGREQLVNWCTVDHGLGRRGNGEPNPPTTTQELSPHIRPDAFTCKPPSRPPRSRTN